MRLPYGVHADAADASCSLDFIAPDIVHTVDVRPTEDAMRDALVAGGWI